MHRAFAATIIHLHIICGAPRAKVSNPKLPRNKAWGILSFVQLLSYSEDVSGEG